MSEEVVGRSEGGISEAMGLWDHVEQAVNFVDGDLPRDEDWLPAEFSVEITIQPEVDDSE